MNNQNHTIRLVALKRTQNVGIHRRPAAGKLRIGDRERVTNNKDRIKEQQEASPNIMDRKLISRTNARGHLISVRSIRDNVGRWRRGNKCLCEFNDANACGVAVGG